MLQSRQLKTWTRRNVSLRKILLFLIAFSATAFPQTIQFGGTFTGNPQIPDLLKRAGPSGYGWTGCIIRIGPYWRDEGADAIQASSAGYKWILGWLNRDSIVTDNWSYLQAEIDTGKVWGINCYYIDDGYSEIRNYKTLVPDAITKTQIDSVGAIVHRNGFPLAVSEYNLRRIREAAGMNWYDSVDYVLPFYYSDSTVARYTAFMDHVRELIPGKMFIPQLGFYAERDSLTPPGSYWPDQIGTAGGGNGILDAAIERYADAHVIFYYFWWNGPDSTIKIDHIDKLTNYLQTYDNPLTGEPYMSGKPVPQVIRPNQK